MTKALQNTDVPGLMQIMTGLDGDFSAAYMAVKKLRRVIETDPAKVGADTVRALENALNDTRHAAQTQAMFLYREVAEALAGMFTNRADRGLAERSFNILKKVSVTVMGKQCMAASEALGSLPVGITGPKPEVSPVENVPQTAWPELTAPILNGRKPAYIRSGRSIVAPLENGRLLTVKLARRGEDPHGLAVEAAWMRHLKDGGYRLDARFNVPEPVPVNGGHVFRVRGLPPHLTNGLDLDPQGHALAFVAPGDYFAYPNDHRPGKLLDNERFLEVMLNCARLMGELAAKGILHCAPVPLFHNRVQQNRRDDRGRYLWQRMGRLDQWLFSCRYPNFGRSGLRDFEHFESAGRDGRALFRHVGLELLSLFLVAGSYFRAKAPDLVGLDSRGEPVDARGLFDRELLIRAVQGIFYEYYRGFTGEEFGRDIRVDVGDLADRMIEEMGVDRHMMEIIRVDDQANMTDPEFVELLVSRGFTRDRALATRRGQDEISIPTGPHLGEFNRRISLPELIEFTAGCAAGCIAGRYLLFNNPWRERAE